MPVTLLVVADGVGGGARGEVASSIAVETVTTELIHRLSQPSRTRGRGLSDLRRCLFLAHEYVRSEGLGRGVTDRMATTLVAAVLSEASEDRAIAADDEGWVTGGGSETIVGTEERRVRREVLEEGRPVLHVAYVGDSRAYLYSRGTLRRLTDDHSMVEELIRMNRLDPKDADKHQLRNVITRALGSGETLDPDSMTVAVSPGDLVMLCSDGVTSMIDDAVIAAILARPLSPDEMTRILMEASLSAGGRDNVTVVMARVPDPADCETAGPSLTLCHDGRRRTYRPGQDQ